MVQCSGAPGGVQRHGVAPGRRNNGLEKVLECDRREIQRAGPDEVQKIDREVFEALGLRDDAFHPPSLGSIVGDALRQELGVAL